MGLPFPRPFFGFLFCFFVFGVVESAMKLGMDVWVGWEYGGKWGRLMEGFLGGGEV